MSNDWITEEQNHKKYALNLGFANSLGTDFEATAVLSRVRSDSVFVLTSGELASRLQEASVKIINRNTCNKLYDDAVTPRMLCAGSLLGGVDACQVSVCLFAQV